MSVPLKFRWWSLRNWTKGYRFDPVQRFRCCGHTTPSHYWVCPNYRTRLPRVDAL